MGNKWALPVGANSLIELFGGKNCPTIWTGKVDPNFCLQLLMTAACCLFTKWINRQPIPMELLTAAYVLREKKRKRKRKGTFSH